MLEIEGEKEKMWINDVTPASGPGAAPEGVKGDGPWNHRLLIAISNDGSIGVKPIGYWLIKLLFPTSSSIWIATLEYTMWIILTAAS